MRPSKIAFKLLSLFYTPIYTVFIFTLMTWTYAYLKIGSDIILGAREDWL
jgi:hypothetical protein